MVRKERPDQGLESCRIGENGGASLSRLHIHALRTSFSLWSAALLHISISASVPVGRMFPTVSLVVERLLHVFAAGVGPPAAPVHVGLRLQAVCSRNHLYELTHLKFEMKILVEVEQARIELLHCSYSIAQFAGKNQLLNMLPVPHTGQLL